MRIWAGDSCASEARYWTCLVLSAVEVRPPWELYFASITAGRLRKTNIAQCQVLRRSEAAILSSLFTLRIRSTYHCPSPLQRRRVGQTRFLGIKRRVKTARSSRPTHPDRAAFITTHPLLTFALISLTFILTLHPESALPYIAPFRI